MARSSSRVRRLPVSLTLIAGLIAVVAADVLWRSRSVQPEASVQGAPASIRFDRQGALGRLAGAIRIPTVSQPAQPPDRPAMLLLHRYLEQSFPLVAASLRREVVDSSSLLYTWPGSEPGLPPVLLLGHMDVVPVDSSSLNEWTHAPFSGSIADGFIWVAAAWTTSRP